MFSQFFTARDAEFILDGIGIVMLDLEKGDLPPLPVGVLENFIEARAKVGNVSSTGEGVEFRPTLPFDFIAKSR